MLRLAAITAVMMAGVLLGAVSARGDGFDPGINLELAFRDSILEQPAPQRYQTLIREGETTITFVRDLPETVGKTDFFLNMEWSYDYRYTTQTTDGITEVSVTAMNLKLSPRLRHVIRLPVAFYHAGVWESQLLGHEFDHVAVSLDPRPQAMLVHLCQLLPAYRFSIIETEKPSDKQMREGINREIQCRQVAILELLRANYLALDKASEHGRSAMEDRNAFFESLYTRENLEAAEFPYLEELAMLLESDSYKSLRPHHIPADPIALPRR